MTLQQLRYLVAIADHGTMTAAAAAVYVAQPALSRAVHALQRELRVTLFTRTGRTITLTDEGHRVVRLARSALATVDSIPRTTAQPATPTGPPLRVVATPMLAMAVIGGVIPRFRRTHPATPVEVTYRGNRDELSETLRTGHADIGIVDLPVDPRLTAHRVRSLEVVLTSPRGTALPDPVSLSLLDGLPMVLPSRGSTRRSELDGLFALAGVHPFPVVETDERVTWVSSVLDGIASLLCFRESTFRTFGARAEVRSFAPRLARPFGVVHTPGPLGPAARTFLGVAARKPASGGEGVATSDHAHASPAP
ncbi:LysR family transcriptional regulator [Haloechinothrix sp. YIM 98757]|uniref:LysR family transcriptional regulator n=1 Tax=Haloechinothrix aidingensis TaxID=2752311 RepID=A0A838ADW9_9PSEU|nr:LysR family transcriptional regulator [Haloechinothrix aidingensis]MBA0127482.1 LysR family transcriptional regulator [Haloechinothrix aidingensis]